jgi:hypothetical protein
MIQYVILKNGTDMLLNPPVDGDQIYFFESLEQAQQKIEEIKDLDIYQNISLSILKIDYPEEE